MDTPTAYTFGGECERCGVFISERPLPECVVSEGLADELTAKYGETWRDCMALNHGALTLKAVFTDGTKWPVTSTADAHRLSGGTSSIMPCSAVGLATVSTDDFTRWASAPAHHSPSNSHRNT
jgi:glutamine cyclotransferase